MKLYIYPTKDYYFDYTSENFESKKLDFKEMNAKNLRKYNLEFHKLKDRVFWLTEFTSIKLLEEFIQRCPHHLIFTEWEGSEKDFILYSDHLKVELYNDYRE